MQMQTATLAIAVPISPWVTRIRDLPVRGLRS